MATASKSSESICGKFGLKPFTANNILFYYAPIQGTLGYTALSVNVMNPSLVLRLFPRKDITNILLVNSLIGTGLYLYNRPHLSKLSTSEKVLYSTFGAVSFSLGSVLIWAILRSLVYANVPFCTLCGIGSSLVLIKIGRGYVDHVDSLSTQR